MLTQKATFGRMNAKMESFAMILVMSLAFIADSSHVVNRMDEKCTANDPRTKLYPICMYESKKSTLWCNYSNYTKIPDPDAVEKEIYQPCKSATTLDISDSCLHRLRRDDLAKYPNLMTLKCRQNLISEIRAGSFGINNKLESLDFCTNDIKKIETDGFKELERLSTLILDNNYLQELNEEMFRGLSSLKKLSIHNNDIAVLRRRTFVQLRRLEVLILTGNRIAHIGEEAFAELKSLTTLQLDENKLHELGGNTLAGLTSLRILTLSYNNFVAWPDFGENALVNLQTLNLGHNMLEEIKSSNIANLSKLQNLSLENNSLHTLPEDLHLHTPNLRYLNISKNHLKAIGEFAFTQLSYLETLDLRDNMLTTPYAEWFSRVTENGLAIPNVTSGNGWNCDCQVIQYQEFLTKLGVEWQEALRIVCHSPKQIVLQIGKVLNAVVVEAIQERDSCGAAPPFVSTKRLTNSPYPFTKTEVIIYHPKTKEDTTTEATTTAAHSITRRDSTTLQTPPMEEIRTASTATILVGVVLAFILIIVIAVFVLCILRKRQLKAEDLDSKNSFHEDSRTDVEAGGPEKPLLDSTLAIHSERSSTVVTQIETPQGSTQDEDEAKLSMESTSDPKYMTMQTVPNANTIPKEIGPDKPAQGQQLQPWPPGVRRQPDGASFKKNDV